MYTAEIERELAKTIRAKTLPHNEAAAKYLNTRLKVAGLAVPVQRQISKAGFSFSGMELSRQLKIWDEVYKTSEVHEVKSQSLLFIERTLKITEKEKIWNTIKHWIKFTDNWGHSDALSSYYTKILEDNEPVVLPQLKKWNVAVSLWERRQSIVSLLYYARTKKTYVAYEEMQSLVEPLLDDKEYYVQKGVGWTLREMRKAYAKQTKKFVEVNVTRISPVAFTAAIEKLPEEEKVELKLMRKKNR